MKNNTGNDRKQVGKTVGVRIAAGALAALLLIGIGGCTDDRRVADRTKDEPETVQTQPTENEQTQDETQTEDETPVLDEPLSEDAAQDETEEPAEDTPEEPEEPEVVLPPGELLTQYLEKTLIPEKGLYDIRQPMYWADHVWLQEASLERDPVTGELTQSVTESMDQEMYDAYERQQQDEDVSGLYFADLYDYDGDGEPELFVGYGDYGEICLKLFDVVDGEVVPVALTLLNDISAKADAYGPVARIYRYSEGGETYIVVEDLSDHYYTDYRLSNTLKPISRLYASGGNGIPWTGSEYSYATGTETDYGEDYPSYGRWENPEICRFGKTGVAVNDFFQKYWTDD